MTLIIRCIKYQEGVRFFFQPPYFVKGLRDKIFERLYHEFVGILETSKTCIHPYY